MALGGGKQHESYAIAKSNWGSADPVTKALSGGDFTGAGALLKDDVADDLTDRLRIRSILRQMGLSNVTAPWGSKDMPVLTSSVTASFSEEGAEIAASDLAVGRRRLDPKRLASLIPCRFAR